MRKTKQAYTPEIRPLDDHTRTQNPTEDKQVKQKGNKKLSTMNNSYQMQWAVELDSRNYRKQNSMMYII